MVHNDLVENEQNSYNSATIDAFVESRVNELVKALDDFQPTLREKCLDELMRKENRLLPVELHKVLSSIKEVVCSKRSKNAESERIRSTLMSAACGPGVSLKTVSEVLGIYEGNHQKLSKYRQRRQAYLSGEVGNMDGDRYCSKSYGFPAEVLDVVKEFFQDPECGTPDV